MFSTLVGDCPKYITRPPYSRERRLHALFATIFKLMDWYGVVEQNILSGIVVVHLRPVRKRGCPWHTGDTPGLHPMDSSGVAVKYQFSTTILRFMKVSCFCSEPMAFGSRILLVVPVQVTSHTLLCAHMCTVHTMHPTLLITEALQLYLTDSHLTQSQQRICVQNLSRVCSFEIHPAVQHPSQTTTHSGTETVVGLRLHFPISTLLAHFVVSVVLHERDGPPFRAALAVVPCLRSPVD